MLKADLLKLGKVLLLAQDTANDSIERALQVPGSGSGRGVCADIKGRVKTTPSTCCLAPSRAEEVDDGPSSVQGDHTSSSSPFCNKIRNGAENENDVEGDNREIEGPPQGRHNARTAKSASWRAGLPHNRLSNDAYTPTAPATDCLWCSPASPERRRRCQGPVTEKPPQRRSNRANSEYRRPYVRPPPKIATAAQHHELSQQRHDRLPSNGRLSASRDHFCHHDCDCDNGGSHAQVSELGREGAGRSTAGAQLRAPLSPPGNPVENLERASPDVPGTTSGRDDFCSPPKEVLFDGENRLFIQGGHGFTAPHSFFCSWECAGKWNARFSPAQTRHERGLKIDIAAGRIVPK